MRLFIDCEWNDYQGDLISMALVAEDGREWYEVVSCHAPTAWVAANVISKLGKDSVARFELRDSLMLFLSQFDSVHVVADWPEDIAWFCNTLIIGPGERIDTPQLTMEVVRVDSVSDDPHNALADAHGLRKHLLKS